MAESPHPIPSHRTGALPCFRVEFCWETRTLLEFLTTHVSFLWGREVRGSKYSQACLNQT